MDALRWMLMAAPLCVAVAYAFVSAYVALRFAHARRRPGCAPPADSLLSGATVHFASRDRRVRIAAWYVPAKPRRGAVIFVHGKDSCRGDALKAPNEALARHLHARGLSVLMIDLRGHGESGPSRLTYGQRERFDVLGALDYLVDRGYAPESVGVLGVSMGGATALHAAAAEPAIGAVVADSAFADFGELVGRHFRKLTGLPDWMRHGALAAYRLLTGVDARRVRPVEHARALRGRPVLIVHGQFDPFIPVAHARALAAAAEAPLWITPSEHHIGSFAHDPAAYAQRIAAFFRRHLLGSEEVDAAPAWREAA